MLESNYQQLFCSECFTLIENHPRYNLISVRNKGGNVLIEARNLKKGFASEFEMLDFQFRPNIFFDKSENNVYFIVNREHEYFLCIVFDKNGDFAPQFIHLYTHEKYSDIMDYTIFLNGHKFCGYSLQDSLYSDFLFTEHNGMIQLVFQKDYYKKMIDDFSPDLEDSEHWQQVADSLSVFTKNKFTISDIFNIIMTENKAGWYKQVYENPDRFKSGIFFDGLILDKLQNGDSKKKKLLINITGERFVPDHLLCYDLNSQQVLWKKEFSAPILLSQVIDIDGDNDQEIILGSYASGCQPKPDWFENKESDLAFFSSLQILDSESNLKIINDQPAKYRTGTFRTNPEFAVIPDKNRIFFGVRSSKDYHKKYLHSIDLINNKIDTLNINFQYLMNLKYENGLFTLIHRDTVKIEKIVLNSDLKIKKRHSQISFERYEVFRNNYEFDLYGKNYFLVKPFTLFDDKMRTVYKNKDLIYIDFVQSKVNSLYFINSKDKRNPILAVIDFYPNKSLNPFFLLLITFELILILMYYYFRQLLFLPFVSGESSYAVLYRIFGSFYFWRIYGKLSFYRFPRNLSRTNNRFFYLLKDLTTDFKEIYHKRSFIMQIRLFQLNTQNELFLVQRIAHDIKNQLHLINLQLSDQEDEKESENIIAQIKPTMKGIYQKTLLLSGFSKLFELNIRNRDLIMILENMVMEYSNHPQFSRIVFKPQVDSFNVDIDENLFQIAIRNLLDNALKYSGMEGDIKIELTSFKIDYKLQISNPGSISENILTKINKGRFSESKSGSGVGIQITKKIIENFNGSFEIRTEDGFVIVTVRMPINNKHNPKRLDSQ